MAITKLNLNKSVGEVTDRYTFIKGAQNDVLALTETFDYVETDRNNPLVIPLTGAERISVTIGNKDAAWEYNTYTLTADGTESADKSVITLAAADAANITANTYLLNAVTNEIIYVYKVDGTALQTMRGMFGTTVGAISEDDVLVFFNQIKLTGTETGLGQIIFNEMPRPGYTQDYYAA